ncbi:hypothetical protein BCR32DRAFT_302757 [Anaeromyces robustus]|uniref:Uncharacterized protein n=1 Tax=Anaeromyces robustus TaxID=1754192 RepID=A0A1Y1WUS5_9FUNG|nr:hypothetical protein BCR32DRAFT_302757 [Anaeromyces robustus]|eukprot:ORX77202.1 hypothetical protein BCR32DRAFT_302757 [Anaeromyces robustus]
MAPIRRSKYFTTTTSSSNSSNENCSIRKSPQLILSDGEEEEKYLNHELYTLSQEFERYNNWIKRTRDRMRKLYERREQLRIRRAVQKRENEIREKLETKWIPDIEEVVKNSAKIQRNLLENISAIATNSSSSSGNSEEETSNNRFKKPKIGILLEDWEELD